MNEKMDDIIGDKNVDNFCLPDGDARLYTNSKHHKSLIEAISDAYCNEDREAVSPHDFSLSDLNGCRVRGDWANPEIKAKEKKNE